jgi:hypothetical protein
MQCRYCKTKLDPLRVIADGKFCSDDHALMHGVEQHTRDALYLFAEPEAADTPQALPAQTAPADIPFEVEASTAPLENRRFAPAGEAKLANPLPFHLLPDIRDLVDKIVPPQPKPHSPGLRLPRFGIPPVNHALAALQRVRKKPGVARRVAAIPVYLKVAASMIPIMFLAALNPSLMSTAAKTKDNPAAVPNMSDSFQQVKDSIKQRAAVILTDDFRSGLDSWDSRANLANAWVYDPNGFVRPSSLAVYRPSMQMKDYTLEFLTQVEQKAVGAAFRVEDWTHYYAVKLVVSKKGSIPTLEALHYTVVNGKEINRVQRPLNIPMTGNSLQRVRLEVHGNDFTLINQGKIVDYWSDGRYSKGGVGFFCGKGERAGVRWVEVSHQQDLLGRFCAFLTPDDGQGTKSGTE